ncbi:MAG: ParB/RepB/Spo0J family partition protein, partial [Sphingomicrobium sp.]
MSESKPHKGLGKGLSALLGDVRTTASEGGTEPSSSGREIEVGRIRPNPSQPRTHFDDKALEELSESVAQRGILQPILVRPIGDGFEIIAGERRWRAAQRAGLHRIPAIVRESGEQDAAELALIENIQREDLSAIEEARGYRQLIILHGRSQEMVARLVHKSRSHIANLIRLLDLPANVQEMLLRGDISMGHARAVVSAPN